MAGRTDAENIRWNVTATCCEFLDMMCLGEQLTAWLFKSFESANLAPVAFPHLHEPCQLPVSSNTPNKPYPFFRLCSCRPSFQLQLHGFEIGKCRSRADLRLNHFNVGGIRRRVRVDVFDE